MFRRDSSNGWLPASRSKKMKRRSPCLRLGLVILLTAALAWFAPAGQAQTVIVTIDGVAVPGADLTATASMDDGTPIQSVTWQQTGGAKASISLADANPTTVTLGAESVFKDELIAVLAKSPIGPDQLPPNVPVSPEEEAAKVTLKATVRTTSGDYEVEAEIHTMLPWRTKADIDNHAIDIPVLLQGKNQASNSSATLMAATTQNPEFIPDVKGQDTLAVTDLAENKTATALAVPDSQAAAMAVPDSLDPVDVTVQIDGVAVPGADLTATAMISIQDGSTIQSVSWMQTGGAPVASIDPADMNPTTVTLGAENDFKDELIHVLAEPPIGPDQLPPNVPVPSEEFSGGLQNRFQVVAVNPFALEEAAKVTLTATVSTTSGVYEGVGEIHTMLPWKVKADTNNQATGIPVLLHGKDQASYDWTLTGPWNSSATLMDATSQNPEFTPDIRGKYTLAVTDLAADNTVTVDVYAGTWVGVITGQDMDGRPLAGNCTPCHREAGRAPDIFTPWAQTGHAEIFTNSLNTNSHYGESCFACHVVGFDLDVDNFGFDDYGDYQGFLDSGLINNVPADNWTTMLAEFPKNARLANVQCENCHGPQSTLSHNSSRLRSKTAVMGTRSEGQYLRGRLRHLPRRAAAPRALPAVAVERATPTTSWPSMRAKAATVPMPHGQRVPDLAAVLWATSRGSRRSVTVNWTEDKVHPADLRCLPRPAHHRHHER